MNWEYELQKGMQLLLARRLRTALSTLGVLFGVAAVVAMLSIGEGAKEETMQQIQQLGIHNMIIKPIASCSGNSPGERDSSQHIAELNSADSARLKKGIPSLMHIAPVKVIPAKLLEAARNNPFEVLAVTRAFETIKQLELLEGRFICDQDACQRQLVCVLGYDVAERLGKEAPLGKTLRLNRSEYLIVGILRPTYWAASKNSAISSRDLNKAIFIPLSSAGTLQESLSEIILQLQPAANTQTTAQIAHHILDGPRYGQRNYQIIIPRELMHQASRTQHTFNLVLGSIAAISLLVGGIGIMNIMLATVSERTREIGIRRAIGASKAHILRQFMIEALLLTSTGALSGVLFGILLALSISHFAAWKTIVSVWSTLLALLMAMAVGICSGLYPAIKAARMDPITALRHD